MLLRTYLLCLLGIASVATAAERPNIMWLSIEDASCHLGCYGDEHARTPSLDAFAKQGVLYENAFVCAPVCAPCRSSIITGVYPTSLGTHNMRSTVKLPPEIRPFTMYLRDAGYYCTNNSKEDYQFKPPKGTWDESSGKAHWRNRGEGQPFFAVFNYTGTHESVVRGDQPKYNRFTSVLSPDERHDPADLELPPYYPDTPKVRQEWARYYNCMTAMDKWVAGKLEELDEAGLTDDTIVFFWSDHGVGLPRGKRWLYDSGIKVPLIVRIPEKWQAKLAAQPSTEVEGSSNADANNQLPPMAAGTRTDELVSLIDLPETVVNLAGLPIPTYMQGRAFLGTNLTPEREFIYAGRDRMDERYDMSRCVRTKRYKYIRNYMPWRPWTQWVSYGEVCDTMQELRRLKAEGGLNEEQMLWMASEKPSEELYDLEADPYEVHNLLPSNEIPDAQKNLEPKIRLLYFDLSDAMHTWMVSSVDIGLFSESQIYPRSKTGLPPWNTYFRNNALFDRHEVAARVASGSWRDPIQTNNKPPEVLYENYWTAFANPAIGIDDLQTVRGQIGAAESGILSGDKKGGLPLLLDAYENAESPWDRLQAANVIDLLPDFDAHAAELKPVVERVRKNLKAETKRASGTDRQGLGYVDRCTERLAERLNLDN